MKRCGRCAKKLEPDRAGKQRYCRPCHAAYMREWRRGRVLTAEQLARQRARAYANVYLRRGKLQRGPCCECGAPGEEMHHDDYGKPLQVRWYCRPCHLAHHERVRVRALTQREQG